MTHTPGSSRAELTDDEREVLRAIFPFARKVAMRFARDVRRPDLVDDFHSEAVMGAEAALRNYDPDQGASFETYASPYMISKIKGFYVHASVPVSVPRELRSKTRTSSERIARHVRSLPSIDIDGQISETEDESLTFADVIPGAGSSEDDYVSAQTSRAAQDMIGRIISRLPKREMEAIVAKYGFGDRNPETITSIAQSLKVSRPVVYSILEAAHARLHDWVHHASREETFHDYLDDIALSEARNPDVITPIL